MSEEKPSEPTSAPLRPYLKKSERKGCVIAMLLGFIIVGLIYIGVSEGSEGWIEFGPQLFSIAGIAIYTLWPIWLMLGVIIGVVCLWNMRKSSNQEEGNLKKSGRKGCVIAMLLGFILSLAWLVVLVSHGG